MEQSGKDAVLSEAVAIAKLVVSGEVPPNDGCRKIAGIRGAIDIDELAELYHLAHLQDGSHDHLGFSKENCVNEIVEECNVLTKLGT